MNNILDIFKSKMTDEQEKSMNSVEEIISKDDNDDENLEKPTPTNGK